jgi:hypothetical protein
VSGSGVLARLSAKSRHLVARYAFVNRGRSPVARRVFFVQSNVCVLEYADSAVTVQQSLPRDFESPVNS